MKQFIPFLTACLVLWVSPCAAEGGIYAVSSSRTGGGHHGHQTDLLRAATLFVLANHPGDEGADGADPRLCAMQRRLGPNPLSDSTETVATLLAEQTGLNPKEVAELLISPVYCRALNASLRPKALPQPLVRTLFYVDAAGIPVALHNPVFDRCIAGKPVPLALIRANPDRITLDHRGKITAGASCQKYFIGDGRWRHPDHPELDYFTFTLKPRVFLALPLSYVPAIRAPDGGNEPPRPYIFPLP
ncbi:MAG TPA: hypothetical protein PKV72_02005 [Candidatus Peribacteria bacterium]|nr:hypothetical protein [Candidatus Peribacteria bacterium]